MTALLMVLLMAQQPVAAASEAAPEALAEPRAATENSDLPWGLVVGPAAAGAAGVAFLVVHAVASSALAAGLMFLCPCLGDRERNPTLRESLDYYAIITAAGLAWLAGPALCTLALVDLAGLSMGQLIQKRSLPRLGKDVGIALALAAPTFIIPPLLCAGSAGLYGSLFFLPYEAQLAVTPALTAMFTVTLASPVVLAAWFVFATLVLRPLLVLGTDKLLGW